MSDEDSSQRTEQPTARRLRRARDEGQVARSVELSAAAVTLSATLMFFTMGGAWLSSLSSFFAAGFTFDRKVLDTPALLPAAFASQLTHAFMLLLPVLLLVLVVAVLAAGATGGYLFSLESVMPKASKLNPITGLKRMFGPTAAVELLKALLKVAIVSVVLLLLVDRHSTELLMLGSMALKPALALAGSLISESALWLTFSLVFIAMIDVPYQRFTFMKRMRMTKQEIKDEMKDMEGRPEVKAQIRRRQREVANARMMQKVKEADVIITNPEHFAVALSYDPSSDGAPIVLAKGADHMALRIRMEANNHGVEIFAAPELARALYFTTALEQSIPDALYFAVAQVIAYVFGLGQVQPGIAPMARPVPKIPASMLFDSDGHHVSTPEQSK
ncbi:MAG: flagellar biosynthesis protein FlhB [Comamonadaceae bacterium]